MDLYSNLYKQNEWQQEHKTSLDSPQTLMFVFFDSRYHQSEILLGLHESYPNTHIVGCSTAGEIINNDIHEGTIVYALIKFESTSIQKKIVPFSDFDSNYLLGKHVANSLHAVDLKHIFLFASGATNMDDILKGVSDNLPGHISISGGLAGDGEAFGETYLFSGDTHNDSIIAVGLCGDDLVVHTASDGGWQKLGKQVTITKANKNILYEIDNKPALDVYKQYLGKLSKDLPSSALFYPLAISSPGRKDFKVRTILGVDESEKSLVFASDIYNEYNAYFMRTTRENLLNAAISAADKSRLNTGETETFYLLINCVGRKLVLGQTAFDELNATLETLSPQQASHLGFYSYGEISTPEPGQPQLFNQTMTITALTEKNV